MTTMVRCLEGHAFDMDATSTCPRCGSPIWKEPVAVKEAEVDHGANRKPSVWVGVAIAIVALSLIAYLAYNALTSSELARINPSKLGAQGDQAVSPSPTTGVAGGTEAPKDTAPTVSLPDLLAKADPKKGEFLAKICQACHSFDKGGPVKVGPPLYGVVGRAMGSVAGFAYSDSMRGNGGNWTYEDLNTFITNPKGFVSGTKMVFFGEKDPVRRADILAYLRTLSDNPVDFPK